MGDVQKPVALVSGGLKGIGRGISENLSALGYTIVMCGRSSGEAVEMLVNDFRKTCGECIYLCTDIGKTDERRRLVEEIKQRCGRIDVLVNNGGIALPQRKDILDADEDSWDTVMNINLKGPYFLTQTIARWMIALRRERHDYRPSIINISSISASVASVGRGEYCVSKAGIAMASQLWAVRLAEYGIPVYEIRPGIIESDMTAGVKEKYDALIKEGLLLQPRWGTPGDVGRAVASLVKGDFSYSTGMVCTVDGGMTVGRL